MTKQPAKRLPSINAFKGKQALQKIKYDCGCEAVGPMPMPSECPTHGKFQPVTVTVTEPEILVSVVLDESGSMSSCRDQTISGYNEYLNGLRKDGKPYLITLAKFDLASGDPTCRVAYKNTPVAKAPELSQDSYTPRGSTPLYDAVGITIKAIDSESTGKPVLFMIITDGEENASREFTAEQVKAMIREREQRGWTFVYLGANQDAWVTGQAFGVRAANAATYGTQHMQGVMNRMAHATMAYAGHTTDMLRSGAPVASCSLGNFYEVTGTSMSDLGGNTLVDLGQSITSTKASEAGKASAEKLTPQQRKQRAKNAALVRWRK